jgi:ankyrin repeat protein
LEELHRFCLNGRLYDVERWIQAGRPMQLAAVEQSSRFRTALEIALERQDHSLVRLLVANGYDMNAEPVSPLDRAVQLRHRDLLDLLLDWGADPRQVDLDALCATYDSQLYERFRRLGVDFTSGHALAHALAYHTSNKPLFGFAKRHRLQDSKIQTDLDIALAHHAWEGNEKGVLLCLWAGANPHAAVPDLRWGLGDHEDEADRYSAVDAACSRGHIAILERLKPDPSLDDYEELYFRACNKETVELLAHSRPPANPSRIVVIQLSRAAWSWRQDRPVETLQALFEAGVRWEASSTKEITGSRRSLLKADDSSFVRLMRLLATDDYCSREVLAELARTPNMRERMVKVGLIPPNPGQRSQFDPISPTRSREALGKFGIELPKKPAVILPRVVRIGGGWNRKGRDIHLDRPALFERVWSGPVDKLAKEWGLSDRGLSKACGRLQIPVPPRGYWARVAAGQRVRRPKLPILPPGQAEEILIRVPEPGVDPGPPTATAEEPARAHAVDAHPPAEERGCPAIQRTCRSPSFYSSAKAAWWSK